MKINLKYCTIFGKYDESEPAEWGVELSEAQEKAYKTAIDTNTPFEDYPELIELLEGAAIEIEEQETKILIEVGDEYTLECLGEAEVNPEEINDLVQERDSYTLSYFGIENMDEEELDNWDANELDSLPLIKDFVEDFEPGSSFDNGWLIKVWIPRDAD